MLMHLLVKCKCKGFKGEMQIILGIPTMWQILSTLQENRQYWCLKNTVRVPIQIIIKFQATQLHVVPLNAVDQFQTIVQIITVLLLTF